MRGVIFLGQLADPAGARFLEQYVDFLYLGFKIIGGIQCVKHTPQGFNGSSSRIGLNDDCIFHGDPSNEWFVMVRIPTRPLPLMHLFTIDMISSF